MTARALAIDHERFTGVAKWASFEALLFVFSIDADYRLNVAGLLVHPYLPLLPIAMLFGKFSVTIVPQRISIPLYLFFLFFTLGSLQNINPISEVLKVAASIITFLFFAQSVHSDKDFRMVSWGFLVVAIVIGVMGFLVGEESTAGDGRRLAGINVLEGIGNKNAQSLFTLPGLFFAIFLLLHYLKHRNYLQVVVLLISIFFITTQIFLSGNRSGWVGLFVIIISYLIFSGINTRTLILSAVLTIFAYVAVENYAADIYKRKATQTLEGYGSDEGRRILIIESLTVGLENPIFGVGFDRLAEEMASRLGVNRLGIFKTDTHFLIGYIFGATGIFSLFFFLLFLWRLCQKRIRSKRISYVAHKGWLLLVSFVVLFVIRSFFTREILYSPTFIGGLGLIYGYYLMHVRNVNSPQ